MKKLELYLNTCSECPYCQYDGNYGISYDSGYDCNHDKGSGRLVNDNYWDNLNPEIRQKGIPIPSDCPLQDVGRKDKLEKILTKTKEEVK